jgi:hypothetical protein
VRAATCRFTSGRRSRQRLTSARTKLHDHDHDCFNRRLGNLRLKWNRTTVLARADELDYDWRSSSFFGAMVFARVVARDRREAVPPGASDGQPFLAGHGS